MNGELTEIQETMATLKKVLLHACAAADLCTAWKKPRCPAGVVRQIWELNQLRRVMPEGMSATYRISASNCAAEQTVRCALPAKVSVACDNAGKNTTASGSSSCSYIVSVSVS